MLNIVILVSGSGKGTQTSLVKENNYDLVHISTGDVLKEYITRYRAR